VKIRPCLACIACGVLVTMVTASVALAAPKHTEDSLDDVKRNLAEKKAVLIDVREQREWDLGHVKSAQLVPLSHLNKVAKDPAAKKALLEKLPKDRIIYCHCARGARALLAGEFLEGLGYTVRPLAPGFSQLKKAGFETESKQP
jgi:phage shock protein E